MSDKIVKIILSVLAVILLVFSPFNVIKVSRRVMGYYNSNQEIKNTKDTIATKRSAINGKTSSESDKVRKGVNPLNTASVVDALSKLQYSKIIDISSLSIKEGDISKNGKLNLDMKINQSDGVEVLLQCSDMSKGLEEISNLRLYLESSSIIYNESRIFLRIRTKEV